MDDMRGPMIPPDFELEERVEVYDALGRPAVPSGDSGSKHDESLTGRMADKAEAAAASAKDSLAGGIHDVGDSIEHKGRTLEDKGMLARPIGKVLDRTGNAIESGARYLRSNSIGVIGDDVVDGIRHHPFLSSGIALGAGFLLGQAFGSDEEEIDERDRQRESESDRGHDRYESRSDRAEHRSTSELSFGDRAKRELGRVAAGGLSAFAAKKVRDRIAGS